MATPLEERVLAMSVLPVGVEPVAYTKAVRAAALPWNQRRERRRRIEERARSPRRLLEHEPLFTVAVSSAPTEKERAGGAAFNSPGSRRTWMSESLKARAHGERGCLKAHACLSAMRVLPSLQDPGERERVNELDEVIAAYLDERAAVYDRMSKGA